MAGGAIAGCVPRWRSRGWDGGLNGGGAHLKAGYRGGAPLLQKGQGHGGQDRAA